MINAGLLGIMNIDIYVFLLYNPEMGMKFSLGYILNRFSADDFCDNFCRRGISFFAPCERGDFNVTEFSTYLFMRYGIR